MVVGGKLITSTPTCTFLNFNLFFCHQGYTLKDFFTDDDWDECERENLSETKWQEKAQRFKNRHDRFIQNCINKQISLGPVTSAHLPDETRIILVGKTGVGKSSTANTLFGEQKFATSFRGTSVTQENQVHSLRYKDKVIRVLDTPGLFDTTKSLDEVAKELVRVVEIFPDGIHAFLYIMNVSNHRFTNEDQDAVREVKVR